MHLGYVTLSTSPLPHGMAAIAGTADPSLPLSLRMPQPMVAWLDREAERLNCTRAALIRGLIAIGLDRLQQGDL